MQEKHQISLWSFIKQRGLDKKGRGLNDEKNEVGAENCSNLHNECYVWKGYDAVPLPLLYSLYSMSQVGEEAPFVTVTVHKVVK